MIVLIEQGKIDAFDYVTALSHNICDGAQL